MRHFVGFIVGLLLAPVILVGLGWAQPRLAGLAEGGGTFTGAGGLVTVAGLSAIALVVAVAVAAPRLTPLLPGIAGLTLFAATAVMVLRPGVFDRVPAAVPGIDGAELLLRLGAVLPVALLLAVPLLIPGRWVPDDPGGVSEDEYFDGLYDEDYEEDRSPRRRVA
ncbi:hypothetical protein [Nocardiopsis coralliicola]